MKAKKKMSMNPHQKATATASQNSIKKNIPMTKLKNKSMPKASKGRAKLG